jgi:phosphoribosylanthranilate isomerase
MSALLKVCGVKTLGQTLDILALGVDYIGLNNIASSKRYLDQSAIAAIVEGVAQKAPTYLANLVLLTKKESVSEAYEVARNLGFKSLQAYVASAQDINFQLYRDKIQIFRPLDIKKLTSDNPAADSADYFVLDSAEMGGSGRTFNWNLFNEAKAKLAAEKLVLAGGLKPENIATARAQTQASFYDLASGVEDKSGFKDLAKIKQILEILKD